VVVDTTGSTPTVLVLLACAVVEYPVVVLPSEFSLVTVEWVGV